MSSKAVRLIDLCRYAKRSSSLTIPESGIWPSSCRNVNIFIIAKKQFYAGFFCNSMLGCTLLPLQMRLMREWSAFTLPPLSALDPQA
jgi:hypothetical protein